MTHSKEILILVNCYNNEKEVICFANHLSMQSFHSKILLAVTCNSTHDKKKMEDGLQKTKIAVIICDPNKNLGYLHGCLFGYRQAIAFDHFKWIMIANTDITFQSPAFFEKLLSHKFMDDIWCIAPRIVLPSGKEQNPFLMQRPTVKKMHLWKMIESKPKCLQFYTFLSKIKNRLQTNRTKPQKSKLIYAPHGSCFLLKPDCIEILNKTYADLFMYGEEIFVAEIILKNQKKVFYEHSLLVHHHENATTKHINYQQKARFYERSFRYLINTFFKDE